MNESRKTRHGAEGLRVYQLAEGFADLVDPEILRYVRSPSLSGQLRRAAESIVLNIAEGAAHYSPGRKVQHYQLAHGSAAECIAALRRIKDPRASRLVHLARARANMICVMLTALIRATENREK